VKTLKTLMMVMLLVGGRVHADDSSISTVYTVEVGWVEAPVTWDTYTITRQRTLAEITEDMRYEWVYDWFRKRIKQMDPSTLTEEKIRELVRLGAIMYEFRDYRINFNWSAQAMIRDRWEVK